MFNYQVSKDESPLSLFYKVHIRLISYVSNFDDPIISVCYVYRKVGQSKAETQ